MTKYLKKNFKKFYVKKKNYRWSSLAKKACLKAGLGLGLPLVPAVLPKPYSTMGYNSCRKAKKVPRLLPEKAYQESISMIGKADCLIIGGTSLEVGSAAQLAHMYHGKYLVIINKSKTKMEGKADLVFHDSIGKIMSSIGFTDEAGL